MHIGDVVLAPAQVGLVDARNLHSLEAVQGARAIKVELDALPMLLVPAAQRLGGAGLAVPSCPAPMPS
jgi:hypothetical protein